MILPFKKLYADAEIPYKAHDRDACFDLYAHSVLKEKKYQISYGTGIAVDIPEAYVGLLFPRSSVTKSNMFLQNSVGVIDSGYHGEIIMKFATTEQDNINIYKKGDRIGQLLILPIPSVELALTDTFEASERGSQGFGSTNVIN